MNQQPQYPYHPNATPIQPPTPPQGYPQQYPQFQQYHQPPQYQQPYPQAPMTPQQAPPSAPIRSSEPAAGEEPIPKRIAAMEVHKHLKAHFMSGIIGIGSAFVIGILGQINLSAAMAGIAAASGYFVWTTHKVKREMTRLEQNYRINTGAGFK